MGRKSVLRSTGNTNKIFQKKCTTVVFGKHATADGSVLMAHTEDGAENEEYPCRHLVYRPRATYPPGAELKLTAETITQVPVTYAYYSNDVHGLHEEQVVDGINEYGVAIASNAIYTKEQVLEKGGISWTENIKLVMERCKTAKEGVDLITQLLDKYGNSFLTYEHHRYWSGLTYVIVDSEEAWIIECTPRHWAAKRCPDDGVFFYANEMLLENDYDMASDDLTTYAVEKGWYDPSSGPFSFKRAYGTELGQDWNVGRMKRMDFLLSPKIGTVRVQDLMAFLRDHYEGTVCNYHYPPHAYHAGGPYHAGGHYTICNSTTHDAEVWHLRSYMPTDIGCVMWCCLSSPCQNVFQPIWAGARVDTPLEYTVGAGEPDLHSAWWATQSIRRMVDRDYENRIKLIRETWQQREAAEFDLAAEREMLAMILWQNGQKDEARELLAELQNACLHGNYLTALNLLQ